MKNSNTKNGDTEASKKLEPARTPVQANAKANRTKKADAKSNDSQKWGAWRTWKQASRGKQIKWVAEGLVILTGLGVLVTYILDHVQRSEEFQIDQRPRIVVGAYKVADTVTRRYELNVGHAFFVEVPFQNIGKSTAYHLTHHRHVLFGKQYSELEVRIEPPDVHKSNERLDPSSSWKVMDAVSVKDTYKIESAYIPPDAFVPWNGVEPIVVFGRITYEDSFGTEYCTPFGAAYLNDETFSTLSDFPPQNISVTDLCPKGMIQ